MGASTHEPESWLEASHEVAGVAAINSLFSSMSREYSSVSVVMESFTMSFGQRNVTTAIMISDSNYFSSSNNSENTAAANSQINSCECFILANCQGGFMGNHIKNVAELLRMLFFLAWI